MIPLGKYAKFITAIAGQAVAFITAYYGGSSHWVTLVVAVAAALGVYAVPNSTGKAPPAA